VSILRSGEEFSDISRRVAILNSTTIADISEVSREFLDTNHCLLFKLL